MNYPYKSIQLIDGEIKAVVNKKETPNQDLTMFDDVFKRWQQNLEVFYFANPHEKTNIIRYLSIYHTESYHNIEKQCIEVTCIEIKEGKAWFKEEKEDNLKQEFFKQFSTDSFRGYPLEQCHNIWNFFLPHLKSHENEK